MVILIESIPEQRAANGPVEYIELTWHERTKPRLRSKTTAGNDVALALPRGSVLHDGTLVYDTPERSIVVRANLEDVVLVEPADVREACKIAHHLGNWHRSLELCDGGVIATENDQPLEDWLKKSGFKYSLEKRAYSPDVRGDAHD